MNEQPVSNERGLSVRQDFSSTEMVRQAETSISAAAAQTKAMVEARFIVAMNRPRRWDNIRIEIAKMCKDPGFAAEAMYVKPMSRTDKRWEDGDKRERLRQRLAKEVDDWPMGFSVRFIEAVLAECGNFDCDATVVWDDPEKRITRVDVMDLEKNSGFHRTVITPKTVERSSLKKGEEPLDMRRNAQDRMVYIYPATPQQIAQSEAAEVSKSIRTLGERLLKPHHKAEWRKIIETTIMTETARDPEVAKKKLLDSFAEVGVMPDALERYLEAPISSLQPADLLALRKLYVALANAEITWRDVMEAKFGAEGEKPSAGAEKVNEVLSRKPPAKQETPKEEGAANGGASTPQQSPESAAKTQPQATVDEPPADLKDLEQWPDTPEADWYKVQGKLYRWNEVSDCYREYKPQATAEAEPAPKPEQQQEQPKPHNGSNGGGRNFNFGRRS